MTGSRTGRNARRHRLTCPGKMVRSADGFWPSLGSLKLRSPCFAGGLGVDWNARVELFEELRQEHEFGVGTIAGVASSSRRRYSGERKKKAGQDADGKASD